MQRSRTLAVALGVVLTAGTAFAADVVVDGGGKWNKKQDRAVASVGAQVVWKHDKTGIALIQGAPADLASRLYATGAFKTAADDVVIDWQQPGRVVQEQDVDTQAVTPGDDARYVLQWAHQAIGSEAAWAAGCTGAGVRVAIIDGGLFNTHEDLDAQIDTSCSTSFVPGQPYNADTGTFWHGTHVASIVAGEDNTVSGVGVAPDATILGVKALHSGSGSFSWIIGAILYASDPAGFGRDDCAKADIINMSLGAVAPKNVLGGQGGSLMGIMNRVMNFANSRGVLTVTAAGNDGVDVRDYPDILVTPAMNGAGIAVSATGPEGWAYGATDYDTPASYTNYGRGFPWVSAPGGDFRYPGNELCVAGGLLNSCWVFDMYIAACYGTGSGVSSCWAAGTSMATPVVSGIAALIKGVNPALGPGDIKEILADSAVDGYPYGPDSYHGHGWVNAANACAMAQATLP